MFRNLIEYFEQNKEDLPVLVSKFILLILKNYDCFDDKQLVYDFLDLARNCFNWDNFDTYNKKGEDSKQLSSEDRHDIKKILVQEFSAN